MAKRKKSRGTTEEPYAVALFAVKKGDEDWQEQLITEVPERIEDAKKWALSNGFDRLRVVTVSAPPEFGAASLARSGKKRNPIPKRKLNYGIGEWVTAEADSYLEGATQGVNERLGLDLTTQDVDWDFTIDLRHAQDKFTQEANRVVTTWVEKHPKQAKDLIESDDYESEDDIAWNTWAALVGHGVGFWEHMDRDDYTSLKKAIDTDKVLSDAQNALDEEIMVTIDGAIEAELFDRTRRSNPPSTKKLKTKLLR